MNNLYAECGSVLLSKGQKKKKILANASREKQEGMQGQWQQESPFREVLEQVKGNAHMDCGTQMMRRVYLAMKNGGWEGFKER